MSMGGKVLLPFRIARSGPGHDPSAGFFTQPLLTKIHSDYQVSDRYDHTLHQMPHLAPKHIGAPVTYLSQTLCRIHLTAYLDNRI
jgi:hypothetical protein